MSSARVVVADDVIFVREGVASILRSGGYDVVAELPDATTIVDVIDREGADVAVLDIRMPPTNSTEGLDAALAVRSRWQNFPVMLLSQYVEVTHLATLLGGGAAGVGYLLKDRVADTDTFLGAVERVRAGGSALDPQIVSRLVDRSRRDNPLDRLTERERDVLRLMAEGRSNAAIASELGVNPRTVETHIASIFTKLDLAPETELHRRVAAVVTWLRNADA